MEVNWLLNKVTGDVRVFSDNVSALAAMPTDSEAVKRIRSREDMKGMDQASLLAIYNKTKGESLSKFGSEKEALDKTWEAVSAIRPKDEASKKEAASKTERASKINKQSNSKGKTMATSKKATKKATKKTAPAKGAKKVTAPRIKGDFKISLIYKDGNPRRTNTEGFTSWSKLKDGMLLSEARKKGARLVDIRWDEKKGNLKLTPVKSAA